MFGSVGASGILGMGVMMTLHDNFSSSSEKIQSSLKQLSGMTDQAAVKITKSLSMIKEGFIMFAIGAGIVASFSGAEKAAADFEHQMSSVKSVTGATNQEMLVLTQLARTAGREFGFTALEVAKGEEELLKAGIPLKALMGGGLRDALILARAGEMSLAEAAEIASSALNAFTNDVNVTIKSAGNDLAAAANTSAVSMHDLAASLPYVALKANEMGLSFHDTNVALALLGNNFIKGTHAGTGFAEFLKLLQPENMQTAAWFKMYNLGIANVIKGHEGMRKMIGPGGTSIFYDARNQVKPLREIAQILHETFGDTNKKELSLAFDKLFGTQGAPAALALMRAGAEGVDRISQGMAKVTAEMVAQERMKNLTGAWEQLKSTMNSVGITIGNLFLPILTKIVKTFDSLMQKVDEFAKTSLGGFIFKTIAVIGLVLTFAGALLILKGAAIALGAVFVPMMATVWIALAPILPELLVITGAVLLLYNSWKSFTDFLSGNAPVETGFLGFLQRIGAAIWTVIQVFKSWDGTTFDLGGMEDKLRQMGILDMMISLGTWIVRIKEMFKGFWQGIKETFQDISEVWSGFKTDMDSLFDQLGVNFIRMKIPAHIFFDLFRLIAKTIGAVFTIMAWTVRIAIEAIAIAIAGVTAIFYGLYSAAKYVFEGIWNWVHSFNLADWFSSLGDSIASAWKIIKDFFSTVFDFSYLGDMIGKAIIDGVQWALMELKNLIPNGLSSMLGTLNPFGSTSGQMTPAYAGTAAQTQQRTNAIDQSRNNNNTEGNTHTIEKNTSTVSQVVNKIVLDGKEIAEYVSDIFTSDDTRQ